MIGTTSSLSGGWPSDNTMETQILKGNEIVKALVTPGVVRADEPNEIILKINTGKRNY